MEENRENPFASPPPHRAVSTPPPPHPFFSDLEAATPRSYFVPILIAINVLVYLAMGFSGLNWILPETEKTLHWGVDYWPLTTIGEWWRLMTSAFVHFGIFHIALNMWALYAVGKFTERLFGNWFFILIYLFSAVLSGLASIWFEHRAVAAGASGAIFAIYGALLAYLLFQRASFPMGAVSQLMRSTLGFVGINIMFGFSQKGISNSAHVGGLIAGFILGAVFARPLDRVRRKQQTLPKMAAGVFLGAAMVVAGIAYIPKCPYDIRADRAFLDAFHDLAADEKQAEQQFNTLLVQFKSGKLADKDFADKIDTKVVAVWSMMSNQLSAIPVSPASPTRETYDEILQYCQVNRDAYRAFALGLRNKDGQKFAEFDALSRKASVLRSKMRNEAKIEPNEPTTEP